jgi:regulatory protein
MRGPAARRGNGHRNWNAPGDGGPETRDPAPWGAASQDSRPQGEEDQGTADRDPEARARQICLRLLTASPRTRAQLAQAMRRGGVPTEAAEAVLDRFTDFGMIDDAAFGRAWVESRHHSRGLSRRSLSAELKQRGLGGEEIQEAVETLDPEQEVATARRLVERKLASSRGRPPEARIRQAAGLLARKGYPGALVFRLIREAMEREGEDEIPDLDADQYLDPDADQDGLG